MPESPDRNEKELGREEVRKEFFEEVRKILLEEGIDVGIDVASDKMGKIPELLQQQALAIKTLKLVIAVLVNEGRDIVEMSTGIEDKRTRLRFFNMCQKFRKPLELAGKVIGMMMEERRIVSVPNQS